MDLTVAVMLPPREAQDVTRSAHTKMPVLAPVAVYERAPRETITNPVLGYIRVTGCPLRSAQDLAVIICEPDERQLLIGQEPLVQRVAKRAWEADVTALPEKVRDTLLRERQALMSWDEFAAMYGHRASKAKLTDAISSDSRG